MRPDELLHHADRLIQRLARVNNHRQITPCGDLQLRPEHLPLRLARREVVMEVQTDLPDRHHFRPCAQLFNGRQRLRVGLFCLVRMEPDGRVHSRMLRGQIHRSPAVLQVDPRIDDPADPRLVSPRDHLFTIRVELPRSQMRMCVKEDRRLIHYFTTLPSAISTAGVRMASFPESSDAARIIPWDSCPISFAGWRLNTTTTVLPTRSSGA